MRQEQNICQVAFSALDAGALKAWYQDVFQLVDAGGTIFGGPPTSRVQGMPNVWERCLWLIDSQHYFQLEFFQFWSPKSKPRPDNWQPTDIGYSALGMVVSDFEATLDRARRCDAELLGPVLGDPGARRACLRDPEGNLVEVLQRDPLPTAGQYTLRPEVPSVARTMTVSVPDADLAAQTWVEALGLLPVDNFTLHTDSDAVLWGLGPVRAKRRLLSSGNFLVELVQYLEPGAKPWPPAYRICDQGFMNIAIGLPDTAAWNRRFQQAVARGFRPNGKPLEIGIFKVMYVNDPEGFSVELLDARPALWSVSGFNPGVPYVENEVWIDAPPEVVWQAIGDHERMGEWCPFEGRLLRRGEVEANGVGAVRQLRGPGLTLEEEISRWQPTESYSYRLTRGAPLKNHRGDILLTADNGGTHVRWAIQFKSKIPFAGAITAWLLTWVFARALGKLKSLLERRQDSGDLP